MWLICSPESGLISSPADPVISPFQSVPPVQPTPKISKTSTWGGISNRNNIHLISIPGNNCLRTSNSIGPRQGRRNCNRRLPLLHKRSQMACR